MLFPLVCINLIVLTKSYNIPVETDSNKDVTMCVRKIIKDFYNYGTEVIYIDINFPNGADILKAISSLQHVSVVSCTRPCRKTVVKDGYIITVGSPSQFLSEFYNIQKQRHWRPDRKTLIIFNNLALSDVQPIFQITLRFSIVNVIIIDNIHDPVLYTNNPFENYGCGKRFDRIIEKGKCLGELDDIFFYKYETGLKNCTFRANSAHWPPFSINQDIDVGSVGIEEYIMSTLGEREGFKTVHYNYSNDAEDYSLISENLTVEGPLVLIQEKVDHMMFGGMLLTNARTGAFDFIWMHLSYMDDLRVLVKAATEVAPWRNSYLEFTMLVWVGLISAFLMYYIFIILFLPSKDNSRILFKMLDYFCQHGGKIVGNFRFKVVFLFWVWFAFLISSIYQSSLVGLTTNPSRSYQIRNHQDLVKYNLKPCISPVVVNYFDSVQKSLFNTANASNDRCNALLKSIRSVSKSEDLYTVTMYSVYSYYKYNFYDKWGRSEIYEFKNPLNNVIYAIYLYKGFPLIDRLQELCLRLRENGLTQYFFHKIVNDQRLKFNFDIKEKKFHVIVPWYLLITGSVIATIAFIVEINKKPTTSLKGKRTK